MDNVDLMTKHKRFADDYNSGIDRASLCDKYNIAEADFDAFLEFLKRKGFVLIVTESKTIMTHDINNQKQISLVYKVIYIVLGAITLSSVIISIVNNTKLSSTLGGSLIGIFSLTVAIQALTTGEMTHRHGVIKKSDRPITFYTNVAMFLGIGVFTLVMTFL